MSKIIWASLVVVRRQRVGVQFGERRARAGPSAHRERGAGQ